MFFQGERGKFIGFYALAITNGVSILWSRCFHDVANTVPYIASLWTHCWWICRFEPGVEVDLLCASKFHNALLGTRAYCVKVNAIMLGACLVLFAISFPETLFSREEFSNLEERSYWSKLAFRGKVLNRGFRWSDFAHNFKMLKYLAILIPCIFYMT